MNVPTWLGDLTTWVTTIAVLFAAGQYLGERRKRHEEAVREARFQATHLTAWTVTEVGSELVMKHGGLDWDYAREVGEHGGWLRPYMMTRRYRVTGMRFRDNLNQAWATDDSAVLVRAE